MFKFFKIFLLFTLVSQISLGQKLVNSPYSRFGPGTLEPIGSYKSLGMGGTGVALRDPINISYHNPASYSSIDTNSFVFDFGLDYRILTLEDPGGTYYSDDMNFHHLTIGFPMGRNIGFAAGIVPYSSGYYNISSKLEIGDPGYDPLIGEIVENHKGIGGYNKFFFGFGINPASGFSIGANMTFLFGEIIRENRYIFLEDNNYFNNVNQELIRLRGVNFDIGVQYETILKNNYFTSFGFNYATKGNYNSESMFLLARHSNFTQSPYSVDTLSYSPLSDYGVTLPGIMTFGVAFGKKDKFAITADYTMSDWKTADFLGDETLFTTSNSLNVGGEFIPNKFANYNVLNRVEYRVGGRLSNSHIMVNSEQLKEFGITFGAGIPLRRSKSRINVYFEYGSRSGSFDNGLHKETFYNMGISFNFYDYWFIQRKYD